jgi:LEA14-like dessication related protein
MNKLVIYSAVVITFAIMVFGLVATGTVNYIPIIANNTDYKTAMALVVGPLEIKVKSVTVNKTSNNTTRFGAAFDVHNPNQNTILLDGIQYNVYSDNLRVFSGDIGTETQLDVIRGQSAFPVIGDSTITLKDTGILHKNNIVNGTWDKMVDGKAVYVIKGSYSTKQTSNFDYSPGSTEFNSTYP